MEIYIAASMTKNFVKALYKSEKVTSHKCLKSYRMHYVFGVSQMS